MQELSRDDLQRMNETEHEDFVLANVLSPEQFNEKHIRTSINVPVGDDHFEQTMGKVTGNKDRKVVVYCASFECDASPKAAKRLEAAGFSQVYDYAGGTQDWFDQR